MRPRRLPPFELAAADPDDLAEAVLLAPVRLPARHLRKGTRVDLTAADLVLPRLLAREALMGADLADLAHGGVLGREMRFRFPGYAGDLQAPEGGVQPFTQRPPAIHPRFTLVR